MFHTRNRWLVAALALGLAGGACKKDDAKSPDKTADKAVGSGSAAAPGMAKPADTAATPTATPSANANASDLALLPVDAEVVLGLNWGQLQKSALWTQFVAPKIMEQAAPNIEKIKAACGFDPMASITSISIGLKGVGGDKAPTGAFVVHGLDKSKVMGCMDKAKDEAKKQGTDLTVDGDVVLAKDSKSDGAAGFTFVNDSTLVAVAMPNITKEAVIEAAAGKGTLATSPTFTEMYGKINTTDSLWLLMNGNSKAFDKAPMGMKIKAVFGSLNVSDGLSLDMRVRMDSPDKAAEMATMAKGQAASAAKMFDKLDITAEGPDLHASVALSQAKLQALVAQFAPMLGGMGGGGMGGSMGGADMATPTATGSAK